MRNVSQPQALLDSTDLFFGIFVTIFAEHLLLDLFKLICVLIELLISEIQLPCRKDNRILARGVVLIHADQRLHSARQRFDIAAADFGTICGGEDVVRNLAAAVVLHNQYVRILRRLAFHLTDHRKDVLFFQHLFMVVLAKGTKEIRCLMERPWI